MAKTANIYEIAGLKHNAPLAQLHEAHDNWLSVIKPLLVAETNLENDPTQRWQRQETIAQVDNAYNNFLFSRRRRRRAH